MTIEPPAADAPATTVGYAHASQPVRYSRLREMARSPAHFLHALHSTVETPAMRFGRLVHALVLGGEGSETPAPVAVYDGQRRGTAWSDFAAQHAGYVRVTRDEHERALSVRAALGRHILAAGLLGLGRWAHRVRTEVQIAWTHPTGRACSSRLDAVTDGLVVELKTTTNAEPRWFARHALSLHYHAQCAWYLDAARAHGLDVGGAIVVAVEVAPPHGISLHRLTPRALETGRALCSTWMDRLLVCEAAAARGEPGAWPGYSDAVHDLDAWETEMVGLDDDGEVVP